MHNLREELIRRLPAGILELLELISSKAHHLHVKIYLVGGVVRDILLNRDIVDIDLVVESNAIEFVRALGLKDTKIVEYKRFGTVKLKRIGSEIDIATARSEYYPSPGSLPEVKFGSLKEDLFRRDFTINAMAISLNPDNYGDFYDPFHGFDDLNKRLIRVLHDKSFIDDATRMWRAIRYEQRLGFSLETGTLNILKSSLDYLGCISGDRIRHEMELVLREDLPEKIFQRAGQLGILCKLNPGLMADEWLSLKFGELRNCDCRVDNLIPSYLCLLFYRLKFNDLTALLDYLHFSKVIREAIVQTHILKGKLGYLEQEGLQPGEIYLFLKGYPQVTVISNMIAVDSEQIKERIRAYLSSYKNIKISLNGDDLTRFGVKNKVEIKRILENILKERLNGNIKSKEDEVLYVHKLLQDQK